MYEELCIQEFCKLEKATPLQKYIPAQSHHRPPHIYLDNVYVVFANLIRLAINANAFVHHIKLKIFIKWGLNFLFFSF